MTDYIHIDSHKFREIDFRTQVAIFETNLRPKLGAGEKGISNPLFASEITLVYYWKQLHQTHKRLYRLMKQADYDLTPAMQRMAADYPEFKPDDRLFRLTSDRATYCQVAAESLILGTLTIAAFMLECIGHYCFRMCEATNGAMFPELAGVTNPSRQCRKAQKSYGAETGRDAKRLSMLACWRGVRVHNYHFHCELDRTNNCCIYSASHNTFSSPHRYTFTSTELFNNLSEMRNHYIPWWRTKVEAFTANSQP